MKGHVFSAALLVSLVASPLAVAHGPGEAEGYLSKVSRITPALPGLRARVIEGDEKLRLTNGTGRPLVILGYSGEPYLRFSGRGIEVNLHSSAYYLNRDRYAKTAVPAAANDKPPAKWKLVGSGNTYAWHDHRIHWMSTIPPPPVKSSPSKPHHVFDWRVLARAGGSGLTIAGSLDYVPQPKSSSHTALYAGIAGGAGIALLLAGWLLLSRRRRGTTASFGSLEPTSTRE